MMRNSFFLMVIFTNMALMAAPAWYENREIHMTGEMEMIGYGNDAELQNALVIAKSDISSQLESRIRSSIVVQKIRTDNLVSNTLQIQSQHTEAILEDVEIIKQQFSVDDGKWYVAMKYDNIPQINRFIKKLPASLTHEHQNIYLANTYLGQELNRLTRVKIGSKLYWMNDAFYLNRGEIYQKMTLPIPDLFTTYSTNRTHKLKILKKSTPAGVLISDETCSFELSSTKKYVSLFVVNPEGHVFVLEDNILANRKTAPYQFFRKDMHERTTMFVAVFSNSIEDNSFFRMMIGNEERGSYENGSMKFDKFIDFLDGKEFVSRKMVIK